MSRMTKQTIKEDKKGIQSDHVEENFDFLASLKSPDCSSSSADDNDYNPLHNDGENSDDESGSNSDNDDYNPSYNTNESDEEDDWILSELQRQIDDELQSELDAKLEEQIDKYLWNEMEQQRSKQEILSEILSEKRVEHRPELDDQFQNLWLSPSFPILSTARHENGNDEAEPTTRMYLDEQTSLSMPQPAPTVASIKSQISKIIKQYEEGTGTFSSHERLDKDNQT